MVYLFTMCSNASHATNDNKAIYKCCTAVCVCVCVGGGDDLYSRLRLGNTFVFIEPVCASAIYR